MSIIQSTFDKHKKLVLEHAEKIYEGSLAQHPQFQNDTQLVIKSLEELINDPKTQEKFEVAKSLGGPEAFEAYEGPNGFYVEKKVKIHLDDNFTIRINITPYGDYSTAYYSPQRDSIEWNFYLEDKGISSKNQIHKGFDIKDWYNRDRRYIHSTMAHELSHAYKERFHSRGGKSVKSKTYVSPSDVSSGKKNYADYAQHEDERESYLAEMWKEMSDSKKDNPEIGFYTAMITSDTFQRTLESMGGYENVKPKYKKLYYYFLKKLAELWKNAGYKIEKQDINQAVELC